MPFITLNKTLGRDTHFLEFPIRPTNSESPLRPTNSVAKQETHPIARMTVSKRSTTLFPPGESHVTNTPPPSFSNLHGKSMSCTICSCHASRSVSTLNFLTCTNRRILDFTSPPSQKRKFVHSRTPESSGSLSRSCSIHLLTNVVQCIGMLANT